MSHKGRIRFLVRPVNFFPTYLITYSTLGMEVLELRLPFHMGILFRLVPLSLFQKKRFDSFQCLCFVGTVIGLKFYLLFLVCRFITITLLTSLNSDSMYSLLQSRVSYRKTHICVWFITVTRSPTFRPSFSVVATT